MRAGLFSACAILGIAFAPAKAGATVSIHIDLSSQTMHVSSRSGTYSWPISTARFGYRTPRGTFRPQGLQLMHYSKKYHLSPMPHSIFFAGGYAIHGTYETGSLGRPASHGCVRISPAHAAALYQMVQEEGARITISGSPPVSYASWHPHHVLSYAPGQRATATVRAWQRNPAANPQPFWPGWWQ